LITQLWITWEYKSYRNWRQLFKSPELDLCFALTAANNIPIVKAILEALQNVHPFMPTSCPIQPRAEYYYNIPITNVDEGTFNDHKQQYIKLPNGLYRTRIFGNTKQDPVGGYFEWILEVNRPFNFDRW
jgi:aminoglycoside phosphotransferase